MPELAEVDHYRKQWNSGLEQKVLTVELHPKARIFRGLNPTELRKALTGAVLLRSEAKGKQMLFISRKEKSFLWLGIHLGMTGELRVELADFSPGKHDHLVLRQQKQSLIFQDARLFGRIQFAQGDKEPEWWSSIAPSLLSEQFTREDLSNFLQRRARAPLKAVLLMQERFPGIGNWMADEILWRAALHPRQLAGSLSPEQVKALYREIREVCRLALKVIGADWSDPPNSWLFNHRWKKGGRCPKTGEPLQHATIGGRTTCWSPARQKLS